VLAEAGLSAAEIQAVVGTPKAPVNPSNRQDRSEP